MTLPTFELQLIIYLYKGIGTESVTAQFVLNYFTFIPELLVVIFSFIIITFSKFRFYILYIAVGYK